VNGTLLQVMTDDGFLGETPAADRAAY